MIVSGSELMELLGHSSNNITMNTDAHVLDDANRRVADRMHGLFGPTDVTVVQMIFAGR